MTGYKEPGLDARRKAAAEAREKALAKLKARPPIDPLGSKVRGWVQMETVTIGYELWRQLNDFPLEFPAPVDAGPRKGAAKGLADKDAAKAKDGAKPGYEDGEEGK